MNLMERLILAAALMLGLVVSGCGGADDSPTDSAGGTSGSDVGAPDNTTMVPAIKGDNGEWTCTSGLLMKKEPPMCAIQPSTLADVGDDTSSPDEPADAGPSTESPDSEPAGPTCPPLPADWIVDGQTVLCSGNGANCILFSHETDCNWSCGQYEGDPNAWVTDWPARLVGNRCTPVEGAE